MTDDLTPVCRRVHVNIPYPMLDDGYRAMFLERRLNPEIGIDAQTLDHASRRRMKEMAGAFLDNGLRITLHGPFVDLNAGSPDPVIREATRRRLQQLIDVVPIFRPETVVCHGGYDRRRYGYFREEWLALSQEIWTWAASDIRAAGSRLVIENVYEQDPAELASLIDALAPAGVQCCLDVGHLAAFAGARIDAWLTPLAHCIGQFHLHDNHGRHDDHLALGDGSIDFNPLWEYLAAIEHRPVITLEPHHERDLLPSLSHLAARLPSHQISA